LTARAPLFFLNWIGYRATSARWKIALIVLGKPPQC
jgi:hypothetical protein